GLSGARRPEYPVPGTGYAFPEWWPGAPSQRSPGRFPPPGNLAAAQALSRRARGSAPLRYGGGSFVLPRAHWVTARKTIRKRAVNSLVRDARGSVSRDAAVPDDRRPGGRHLASVDRACRDVRAGRARGPLSLRPLHLGGRGLHARVARRLDDARRPRRSHRADPPGDDGLAGHVPAPVG